MKRMMLATTAALTLSAPAFAQSQTEIFVSNAMVGYGYDASVVETLTDAQITELYIALSSENDAEVRQVIDGLELAADDVDTGLVDTARRNDALVVADQALMRAGYPEGTADMLSNAEVASLYIAADSGDDNEITNVINGLQFGMEEAEAEEINSSAERFVVAQLLTRGVDRDVVLDLSDAEFTELFIALTSGDATDLNRVLSSITS